MSRGLKPYVYILTWMTLAFVGLQILIAETAGKNQHFNLPIGQTGRNYEAIIAVVSDIPQGRALCALSNSPAWLTFDRSHFQFTGVPDDQAPLTTYDMTLTLSDMDNPSHKLTVAVRLQVTNGPQITYPDGTPAKTQNIGVKGIGGPGQVISAPDEAQLTAVTDSGAKNRPANTHTAAANSGSASTAPTSPTSAHAGTDPPAAAAPVLIARIAPRLHLSTVLQESATSISGSVTGIPEGISSPVVEVWVQPPGTDHLSLASLAMVDSEGNPTTATQVPLKDNMFTAKLVQPLAAGDLVDVKLIAPPGSGLTFAKGSVTNRWAALPTAIPRPEVFVPEDLTTNSPSTISGHVWPIPQPAIAATAADPTQNILATPGNLPLLEVEVTDPTNGTAPAGVQLSLTDTETKVQVKPDGSFTLPLAKPLTTGQTVRIVPFPPAGHHFASEWEPHDSAELHQDHQQHSPHKLSGATRDFERPVRTPLPVYTPLAMNEPVLATVLTDNITALSGTATASAASGPTVNVGILRLREGDSPRQGACPTMDDLEPFGGSHSTHQNISTDDYELLTGTSGTSATVTTAATGSFSLTLATPLHEGERIQIVQVLPTGTNLVPQQSMRCYSRVYTVPGSADWGRVHADFTAGILISNNSVSTLNAPNGQAPDSGNFSEAHEFLDLTVEKAWALPPCYLRRFADEHAPASAHPDAESRDLLRSYGIEPSSERPYDECYSQRLEGYTRAHWWQHLGPGVSSYFEARLTAIPVSTVSTTTSSTSSSGSSTSGPTTSSCGSTSSTGGSGSTLCLYNQLTNAQTARVAVGVYFPFLITRWDYRRQPNALFVAPLAKTGFDTVTGATSQNVLLPGATQGTINLQNVYNFYAFGGRIGHFHMTESTRRAPETYSYLDVVFGPYSNLESYICHVTEMMVPATGSSSTPTPVSGSQPATNYSGSSCMNDYPELYPSTPPPNIPAGNTGSWAVLDSRKRIYRLDFEGMLKIPNTPLYVGFNANLGQKAIGAQHLDHGYSAPDDVRFLFGTRFDIGAALTKIGITPF